MASRPARTRRPPARFDDYVTGIELQTIEIMEKTKLKEIQALLVQELNVGMLQARESVSGTGNVRKAEKIRGSLIKDYIDLEKTKDRLADLSTKAERRRLDKWLDQVHAKVEEAVHTLDNFAQSQKTQVKREPTPQPGKSKSTPSTRPKVITPERKDVPAVKSESIPANLDLTYFERERDRIASDIDRYAGKITVITERRGSRTRLNRIVDRIQSSQKELNRVVEKEIHLLQTEMEINKLGDWAHDVKNKVEEAIDEADEYIDLRDGDEATAIGETQTVSSTEQDFHDATNQITEPKKQLNLTAEKVAAAPMVQKPLRKPLPMPSLDGRCQSGPVTKREVIEDWLNSKVPQRSLSHPSPSRRPRQPDKTPLKNLLEARQQERYSAESVKDEEDERVQVQRFFQGMSKPKLLQFTDAKEDYEDWRHQFDVFVDQARVPVKHKMVMLKTSLGGKPKQLVANLGYTELQYQLALSKLDARYGGARRMLVKDMERLNNIRDVPMSDIDTIGNFSDQLSDVLVRMVDSGRESELTGNSVLYTMVCQKVPEALLMKYYDTDPGDDGMATFGDWLNTYVNKRLEISQMRSGVQETSKYESDRKHQTNPVLKRRPGPGKSSTFTAISAPTDSAKSAPNIPGESSSGITQPKTNAKFSCPLCKEFHHVVKCKQWTSMTVSQRWKVAKEVGLCYRCLCEGHRGKTCAHERKCGINGCPRSHHRHLHSDQQTEQPKVTATSAYGVGLDGTVQPRSVALRIIPVLVADGDGEKHRVNALLDDGSDSSYLSTEMALALRLPINENVLSLHTLSATDTKLASGFAVTVIESLDGNLSRKIGVRTLKHLCTNLRIPDWQHCKGKWPHLSGIEFPEVEGRRTVDLLLGSDHPELMMALDERPGKIGEPVARLTPLGWTCVGVLEEDEQIVEGREVRCSTYNTVSDRIIDDSLRALWEMDMLEVQTGGATPMTTDEQQALSKATSSKTLLLDRYEIGIPWMMDKPNLPDNYREAERRLLSLEKTLGRKPQLAEQYKVGMKKNIESGYITMVGVDRDNLTKGWYLPHFPVIREDKETTKVRIVMDSAAKCQGVSLNDRMFAGPKLQREIFDILIRFRRGRVGLVGDIKEMFSQVVLAEEDRRFHRVLWRDLDSTTPVKIYEAQRLTFGDKASPFLAQYVLQSHARENSQLFPRAATTCLDSVYMDDAIDSIDTTEEGIHLREDLTALMKSAGFIIRKWCSNDPEVLRDVPKEDLAQGVMEVRDAELPSIKTLGLLWDAGEDCFRFSNNIEPPVTFTKRTLLSRVAKLFDPLQLLAPFTIRAKMLLQKTWILGLDWDQELPSEVTSAALDWFQELNYISSVSVPRWYFDQPTQEVSLHTFSDASSTAYAAVVYIRSVNQEGVVVRKVAAKARVAPLRAVSIPRLELMGAVLGYRLTKKVCLLLHLSLNTVTFWTDSMDVVHWVRSQSRTFKTFVANRISEIQAETLPNQWRHVPGADNPADDATRGLPLAVMKENHRWFAGPDFLRLGSDEWPKTRMSGGTDLAAVEVARCHVAVISSPTSKFIRWEVFSTWSRLIRTCVMVLRFVRLLRTSQKERPSCIARQVVGAAEFGKGEMLAVRQVQLEVFRSTIESLQSNRVSARSPLQKLAPFVDEVGILRVGGRLQHSQLPYDARHPMILPARHHVSELVIRSAHIKVGHFRGINPVLAEVQMRFWIVHGREAVKRVKYNCYQCRRMNEDFVQQLMAPLPSARSLVSLKAFANVGIDFAGPFTTKITRRVSAKRYVCLITCVQTRGVHLEMAYSLDTSAFLMAFSRMVARRGKPEKAVCDNGTNLVAGEKCLRELIDALDREKIIEKAAQQGIDWDFNPPYGSHHGGVFESLIKSTKRGLYASLSQAGITDEELLTALVEVEGILNSRPLLYCSSDPEDEPVLTPNHFLHGQLGGQLAPYGTEELAFNPRQRWRFIQDLVTQFWQRWVKEYLPSLQPRGKWLREYRDLVVDDVVLVVDLKMPRGMWPLGRICQTFDGSDGHVRTVEVLCRGKRYIRPITKLVLVVAREGTETKEKHAE